MDFEKKRVSIEIRFFECYGFEVNWSQKKKYGGLK